jgi:hypothetical protein|tara:strand:+ start:1174 stop:1473 length:300 start_codon:yes stop_codon:yes gene_type:complete
MNKMSDKLSLDLDKLTGRKKICAVTPKRGRLIVGYMADGVVRKESEIADHLRDTWGRDTLNRGRITYFCRCIKDVNGKSMFEVTGKRPRDIRFIPWGER